MAVHLSVTDDQGQPVNGLNQSAFSLTVLEHPPIGDGSPLFLEIAGIYGGTEQARPGFYKVTIQPAAGMNWDRGFIALGLAVKRMVIQAIGSGGLKSTTPRTEYGQTVIALKMVEPAG